jgi:hypothetical protein
MSTCNISAYHYWLSLPYGRAPLAGVSTFWMYQTQTQITLTKQLAIEKAVADCKDNLDILYTFRAGRNGPIDIQRSYKAMCKAVCIESDRLHVEAISYTGCSCLELSTQETDSSFIITGDFCRENSARLLCDKIGYCGIWDCRLDDFMCPRYEWNKKHIPLKKLGSCINASGRSTSFAPILYAGIAVVLSIVLALGNTLL